MSSPILLALDLPTEQQAMTLVDKIEPSMCRLKVGNTLFTRTGAAFIEKLQARGFDVFLDLKFHDIPQTVANGVEAACELGVWMVNLHAMGGERMLTAASDVVARYQQKPLLIAVTVLTSMTVDDLKRMNIQNSVEELVLSYSKLSKNSGCNGVVCSAHEASMLRRELGQEFVLVTPGIRLAGGEAHDQRRVMTPNQAIDAGSTYLVMGRAITQADEPATVLQQVLAAL